MREEIVLPALEHLVDVALVHGNWRLPIVAERLRGQYPYDLEVVPPRTHVGLLKVCS